MSFAKPDLSSTGRRLILLTGATGYVGGRLIPLTLIPLWDPHLAAAALVVPKPRTPKFAPRATTPDVRLIVIAAAAATGKFVALS